MNNGLNGFFGRLLKSAIVFIANRVDDALSNFSGGISSQIGSFGAWAEEIGSGGSGFWNRTSNNSSDSLYLLQNDPRATYEFTQIEQVSIDIFNLSFSEILADVKKSVFQFENTTDFQTKLYLGNAILQRIAVIKGFYNLNEYRGLTDKGVDARNVIIEIMFYPLIDFIEKEITAYKTHELKQVSVFVDAKKILPELNPKSYFSSESYTINYYTFIKSNLSSLEDDVIDTSNIPIETHPVDLELDVIDTSNIPIETHPVDLDPELISETAPKPETKKAVFPWWWLVAGFVGYKILK